MPDNTIEITLQTYGHLQQDVFLSKSVAEKFASAMKGQTIAIDGDTWHSTTYKHASNNHYRILSTRLEDDNPGDPSRGRVVAICQPVQQRQMEVK